MPAPIFTGSNVNTNWVLENPPPWLWGASNSGFSNGSMLASWFEQVFLRETRPNCGSDWRLLIMDNHPSHENALLQQMAFDHKVQFFFLPPDTSHELQPLDVGVFGPLKTLYSNYIEDQAIYDISAPRAKRLFVQAYINASSQAFEAHKVRNSFRFAGIHPFDPSKVWERIKLISVYKAPLTPQARQIEASTGIYQTPRNSLQFRSQLRGFLRVIKGNDRKNRAVSRK
jgi:hypothetical protein